MIPSPAGQVSSSKIETARFLLEEGDSLGAVLVRSGQSATTLKSEAFLKAIALFCCSIHCSRAARPKSLWMHLVSLLLL